MASNLILLRDYDQLLEKANTYEDDFVALDIQELSQHHTQKDVDSTSSTGVPVPMKSLSRKLSLSIRNGAGPGAGEEKDDISSGGPVGSERSPPAAAAVFVAVDGDAAGVSGHVNPTAAGRVRRVRSSRRRPSTWLNSRRVLLIFASLSTMGTLILLYFVLSMGKMSDDGDMDGR